MQNDAGLLVLVTATVRPQVSERTMVLDPLIREAAYKHALAWWAHSLRDRRAAILVVENSGYDWGNWLTELQAETGVMIYSESYMENAFLERGKGVGEALMYGRVAKRIEHDLSRFTSILKCTGRLTLRNSAQIPREPSLARYVVCRMSRDLQKIDTRLFMLDVNSFSDYYADLSDQVDEDSGLYLEHVACRAMLRSVANGAIRGSYSPRPQIQGISGSTGYRYRGFRTMLSEYVTRFDIKVSQGYI